MKDWVKWLIVGILSIVFGVFALSNAVAASLAVTAVTGGLFIAMGVVQIIAAFRETSTGSKLLALLLGALMLFLGISFLWNPLEGMISLTMLVTILIAASGITRLFLSWQMKDTQFFWPMLISGALSVLLAAYIFANFAAASVSLLGILLGVELLFNGAGLVVLALFIRTFKNRHGG
ncbi:HdeD family acid-resistance protein [Qingshengfaniella alkalisoli]|uniref:Acid-resistance membrane protein n=1 Tax=Qingshengfaniella alkalisoli TaxID=2599296 RepID=A0A5B8J280_9RHOB|nr:DUF308 domain-containing protein [Qingshengfaniella alkalisoli]QDY71261.1 hypothetical protein FPZ52_16370 [Qingshengfaniella alkalisoli]